MEVEEYIMEGGEREGKGDQSVVRVTNGRTEGTECEPTMQPKYSMGVGGTLFFSHIHMVGWLVRWRSKSERKRKVVVSGKGRGRFACSICEGAVDGWLVG